MSIVTSGLYEFGPFRLNLEQRTFTRAGQVLPLPPKTFDLLVLLVQRPGHAFSKQELMSALWPDTFVEEANLSFQISTLRKALGNGAAHWIETLPKHGYRFSEDIPEGRADFDNSIPSRGNLPRPRTAFLGREQAIDDVQARLEQTRLLTLTGTGGVGKTRLAIRVAAQVAPDYDAGVWFVDLSALADGTLAARSVADPLGVREEPPRSLIDTLCDGLTEKMILLVLDNCEHIIQESAGLADTLLRRCPYLRILATSRQALDVDGELVWRVPSLSVPQLGAPPTADDRSFARIAESEAVRLFVARAALSGRDFTLTVANAGAVAEIVRASTGFHSPSSWPPFASACSQRSRSRPDCRIAFACSRAIAPLYRVTRHSAPRSIGVTTCSALPNRRASGACRCFPAGPRWTRLKRSVPAGSFRCRTSSIS